MLDDKFSKSLLERISKEVTLQDKTNALSGTAKTDTCVILSCGPGLSSYDADKLTELCSDVTVMAIKQAYEYVPTVVDFLLLNTWNYQKYDFTGRRRPIVVYEKGPFDPPVFGEHDLVYDLPTPSDLSQQLARSGEFDSFTFDQSLDRPWGPGVIYELGFYLAHHMGFKRIVTLGWDVGVKSLSVMPHFYDRPSAKRTRTLAKSRWIRSRPERNKFLHDAGVLYNKPRIIPEEVDMCAAASGSWYDWLSSKGVNLEIVTQSDMLADRIPRTTLEQAL